MTNTIKKPMHIDERWNLSNLKDINLDGQIKNTEQQDVISLNTDNVHLNEAYEYYLSRIKSTDII